MAQEGYDAHKKGDYKTEAIRHRQVQEKIRRLMIFNHIPYHPDQESRHAYAYNSIQAHHNDVIESITALGYLPDDVFFHDKISNQYYIKPEFVDRFKTDGIITNESELLYSDYHLYKKHNRHSILPSKPTDISQQQNSRKDIFASQSRNTIFDSEPVHFMTFEEYDRIAFK